MSKPVSISLAAPKLPATSKQPPSKKRPAANLGSDSDDDDKNHREKVHVITAFDAARGGAVGERPEEEERGPLVIAAMKNRDWRAEAERRRGKGSVWLPPEAFAGRAEGEEAMEVDTGAGVHYGLQVFQRRTEDNQPPPPSPPEQAGGETVETKTEEEQALAALLSNSSKPPSTTLILPSSSAGNTDWRDEQQAYKADVASRPDVPTLDDYAAVPVEEFGAALLRGMGWREGMELGGRGGAAKQGKPRIVEKRPAFLGIGAKAKEEVPELGTWGKADKPGRKRGGKRVDTTYVPVVLVDKKTGRVVDESAAMENGKSAGGGGGADRDRWDGRDKERTRDDPDRRRRDRSRDHRDGHRHHHSHHHRDRDRDRDRERGEKSHRSRDERDSRRRSRDRYERRDKR